MMLCTPDGGRLNIVHSAFSSVITMCDTGACVSNIFMT